MKKVKHDGRSILRLKDNPLERAFHDAWERENNKPNQRNSTLAWLLHGNGAEVYDEPSETERMDAATVIQWLGSPVGFNWLRETLERAGYDVTERKD